MRAVFKNLPALARRDAGDELRTVVERQPRVARAEVAGDALDEDAGLWSDEDGHGKNCARLKSGKAPRVQIKTPRSESGRSSPRAAAGGGEKERAEGEQAGAGGFGDAYRKRKDGSLIGGAAVRCHTIK